MLKETENKWIITLTDLADNGIRAPQGFSLHIDFQDSTKSYYWTTDELSARIFYDKYQIGCPATKARFNEVNDYLYNLSQALDTDLEFKCPDGQAYLPYQNVAIEYILNTDNTLLADAMRSGKTICTLGFINNSDLNKIIIVCPKTVKLGWFNECKKWLLRDYHIQVVNSNTEIRPADIYIINYDILHTKKELLETEWDLVVGDEIHLAKNETRRRSKYIYGLKTKRKLALSGTPLTNKPKDFLTVLQWLDSTWKRFSVRNNKFVAQSGLTLSLPEVQKLARSSVMCRREDTVLKNEPIERRLVYLLPDDDIKPLIKAQINDVSKYASIAKALGLAKVRLILNHIDVYSTEGEKLVVFAYHKDVIRRLHASLGRKAEIIFGESTEAERQNALKRFNEDPDCQVIIGSIPAMSMGIKLSAASHIIFGEFDWQPGAMDQCEARCTDNDQTKPVLVEYLVWEGSLDAYKLANVEYKGELADSATNVC